MTKKAKRILGISLIVVPLPLLVLVLSSYAIVSFVISSMVAAEASGSGSVAIGNIINIILRLLGLISIAGIIFGTPIGIILLVLSAKQSESKSLPKENL